MKRVFAFAALMACLAQTAYAGGLYLYETGIPEVSTAFAGLAARAEDASTAFRFERSAVLDIAAG